jgi:hypothetical protein
MTSGLNKEEMTFPCTGLPAPPVRACTGKAWAEAAWANLFYWNEVEQGGHFAAFEQPEIFAREMCLAFKPFRAQAAGQ